MLPMAITEDNVTKDIYETAKLSIDYVRVKTGMPSNVDGELMKKCSAPTLVNCRFLELGLYKKQVNRCIPWRRNATGLRGEK